MFGWALLTGLGSLCTEGLGDEGLLEKLAFEGFSNQLFLVFEASHWCETEGSILFWIRTIYYILDSRFWFSLK